MKWQSIVKALAVGFIGLIAYYLITTYYGGTVHLPSLAKP